MSRMTTRTNRSTAIGFEPDWPMPAGVGALVTLRRGGMSRGVYGALDEPPVVARGDGPNRDGRPLGGLNLGFHTGDDPAVVAHNRALVQAAVGERHIAWLDQCHGSDTVAATQAIRQLASGGAPVRADAVVTDRDDEVCAVMVADCLPVLLCNAAGTAVGAAHAGWRGLCGGVLEQAAQAVAQLSNGAPLQAYLGPAISAAAFEVGEEVRAAFLDAALPAEVAATRAAFIRGSNVPLATSSEANVPAGVMGKATKYWADLPALARIRLARMGVDAVYGGTLCTYRSPHDFYSYRRDGRTGRFAALIWRQ